MRASHKQSGFSAIEVVIVVAVVAIIGYLGYSFYTGYQAKSAASTASTADAVVVPEITTTAGLDDASTTMDQAAADSNTNTELSELDTELSSF